MTDQERDRYDLFEDVIGMLRFRPLNRTEQHAQLKRVVQLVETETAALVAAAVAEEGYRWASRTESLTAQLREVDRRYMALLKAVADGRAMLQAAPLVVEQGTAATLQPLTDEQMLDCLRSILLPWPMGLTRDSGPYEVTEPTHFLRLLVRAVERAHGITLAGKDTK